MATVIVIERRVESICQVLALQIVKMNIAFKAYIYIYIIYRSANAIMYLTYMPVLCVCVCTEVAPRPPALLILL